MDEKSESTIRTLRTKQRGYQQRIADLRQAMHEIYMQATRRERATTGREQLEADLRKIRNLVVTTLGPPYE